MKITKTIRIAISIVILLALAYGIYCLVDFVSGVDQDYKERIETRDAKIKRIEAKNVVLVQRDGKRDNVIDSLEGIVQQAKLKVIDIQKHNKKLKKEKEAEVDRIKKFDADENVEYFISSTGGSYKALKYNDLYLIKLSSIKQANLYISQYKFLEKEKSGLLNKIKRIEVILRARDKQIEELGNKIYDLDERIVNKDVIIANLRLNFTDANDQIMKFKLGKNLSLGIGGTLVLGLLIFK